MNFRQAKKTDIRAILEINQHLLKKNISSLENGFLLGERSSDYVLSKLDQYFVALDDDKGEVLGYIEIDYKIGQDNFASGNWETEELKKDILEALERNQYIYVIQIAVKEQRKGIGKFLIDSLHNRFQNRILISFVAYKPHYNEISLNFHLKVGFKKAGLFIMQGKFGIERYERICLVRKYH
ncbi:MAG: GNAT family N-acetyltransferase [Candidatus Hodarchaeales archaeon]